MSTFELKTHQPGRTYKQPHFFILNKGDNSGKPLTKPCPNCFVVQLQTEAEKEQLYWLTFGLFQAKAFYPLLRGSVIPFVVIAEVRQLISRSYHRLSRSPELFGQTLKKVQALDEIHKKYRQQIHHIEQAKTQLLYLYFRK